MQELESFTVIYIYIVESKLSRLLVSYKPKLTVEKNSKRYKHIYTLEALKQAILPYVTQWKRRSFKRQVLITGTDRQKDFHRFNKGYQGLWKKTAKFSCKVICIVAKSNICILLLNDVCATYGRMNAFVTFKKYLHKSLGGGDSRGGLKEKDGTSYYLSKLILWWCIPPAFPRPPGCFLCLPKRNFKRDCDARKTTCTTEYTTECYVIIWVDLKQVNEHKLYREIYDLNWLCLTINQTIFEPLSYIASLMF